MPASRPLAVRCEEKIDRDTNTGCWLWTAAVDKDPGYGRIWDGHRMAHAHRVVYELNVGPIPDGLELDHLCRVRHCVNPAHLEPVTHAENVRRGAGGVLKQTCPQGHALLGEVGERRCEICRKEQVRAAYIRLRDKKRASWVAKGYAA